MRWTKASTLDFAGAKIKLLCWVQPKLRFEAFSNIGYLHIIILNNTVLGNKDYCLHPAGELTEAQTRDLAEISVNRTAVSPLSPTPDPVRFSLPPALSACWL